MINGKTVLAVIPARGGSKRVPLKNLRVYRGKTLIEWAADAAKQSKYIDYLVLSSDDDRILAEGKRLGLTSIKRPDWLATDRAMSEGAIVHLLYTHQWADWSVLLQPTSPLRTAEDIDTALERAQLGTGCISFNEFGNRNGAVYVAHTTTMLSKIEFSRETMDQFIIMPNERSLDIDYAPDFDR